MVLCHFDNSTEFLAFLAQITQNRLLRQNRKVSFVPEYPGMRCADDFSCYNDRAFRLENGVKLSDQTEVAAHPA